MTTEIIFALLAFCFVTSITPGPNNLMLMASGANFGVARTLRHVAGITLGFNFMVWMVGLGLMGVMERFPMSFTVMKVASVFFLLYLAWKIATSAAPGESKAHSSAKPLTFFQAAAFQWVNPKAWALALSSIGAYSIEGSPMASLLTISIAFVIVGVPSQFCWLMLGTQLRRLLTSRTRLAAFNWTCAAALVATLWPILSGI